MLEVILDKEFIEVFDLRTREWKILNRIFFNENNIFIICKELLTYIENNLTEENFQKWLDIFQELHDNKNTKVSTIDTLDSDAIYDEMAKNTDNYFFIIRNSNLLNSSKDYIYYLKDLSKNNLLLKDILESNKVVFRNSEFSSQKELESFFYKMYNCSKSNNLLIVSRYNKFDNFLLDPLKSKFKNTMYWTTQKNDHCVTNDYAFMRSKLSSRLKIYVGDSRTIHERIIVIGNMMISFDDDFDKIKMNLDAWQCVCTINSKIILEYLKKKNKLFPLS
ncbi:hypothetical protein [Aliarcobacter butzleri]|uniref:hypothetical protein n=1 Tax=Aliarcobacter butzleri TaxID=28197 RepID=UPI002874BC70|nr:hypothetical protein [Aliarcobacter butzleri]MDS1315687.1 hypothetical protein [Aliarcobacter butzleri]